MIRAIKKGKNNSPGPNGIPNAAIRCCPRAPSVFLEVDAEIKSDSVVPDDFNLSLGWFPPKGDMEGDACEVIRAHSDTRPLAGKNTDNKTIVLANVIALEPQYREITHRAQNGFVSGRNFLNNLVDVDAAARIYSIKHTGAVPEIGKLVKNTPIISSNDFGAAFPSTFHQWIWLVLAHRKLPPRFVKFFQAIYRNAAAVTVHNGVPIILIRFLSGVLQGCPASAMLFNLALDPFLAAFERALDFGNKGIVRACADDVSFALCRLAHLPLLFPIFSAAEHLAGLCLKPRKCKIIPCTKITPGILQRVSTWVGKHIPVWSEFEVTGAAELLGFYVGPLMAGHHWIKPMRKCKKRVYEIKHAGAATALNAFDYNSRVLPVLSYVAQLVPLPKYFAFEQRVAFHIIYHAPFNTFAHSEFFQWGEVGLPILRCGIAASAAALVRAANKTITRWQKWIPQLRAAADAHLPSFRTCRCKPLLSPDFWDSPSFAENLWGASQGCFDNPDLDPAGGAIVLKYCNSSLAKIRQKQYYSIFLDNLHSPQSRVQ